MSRMDEDGSIDVTGSLVLTNSCIVTNKVGVLDYPGTRHHDGSPMYEHGSYALDFSEARNEVVMEKDPLDFSVEMSPVFTTNGLALTSDCVCTYTVSAAVHLLDPNGNPFVKFAFDPPRVELAPGVDWDGAAKMFWNAVAKMVGQPAPFGW
jgi:hypothetical protein